MKAIGIGISLIVFILITSSCQKDEFDLKSPEVDQFVSLLKSGHYFEKAGYELPDFSEKHIGRLLFYVGDTTRIDQFPVNPISSKYTNPKILNECILWTIDGIRQGQKYPSLEPCLVDQSKCSPITGCARLTGKKIIEISRLYISWQAEYQKNPSESLRKKDLFENTPYRWN